MAMPFKDRYKRNKDILEWYDALAVAVAVIALVFTFSLRVVQQRLAQPRPWGHQQVGEFTAFDNLALFQQRRVVTDGFHHLQLVRNQHNGQIEALVNIRQQGQHRGGGLGIQRTGRLIAQQHFRAMPTRCFCPPESCDGKAAAFSLRSTSSSSSRTRASRAALGTPAISSGTATLSATVRACSRLKCWKIIPVRRR